MRSVYKGESKPRITVDNSLKFTLLSSNSEEIYTTNVSRFKIIKNYHHLFDLYSFTFSFSFKNEIVRLMFHFYPFTKVAN